jgi:N utilization substance protein A
MIEQKKFLAALKQIASEKNLEEDVLFEIVKSAFAAAYKKDFRNKDLEVKVELDFNSPDLAKIYVLKEVVEDGELFDEVFEIEETLAKKDDPSVEIGDELYINSTPEGYGRIAAQSAKQVILQKIQEAGRTVIYEKFKNRESQIVMGTVNRVEGFHVFVDVEKTTVLLSEKYRIRNEKYFPGKRLWLYIENVALSSRGPQIVLSRTHKNLVQKVMEVEIPEVASGEVDIVSVARDPGFRSKVAVVTDDENLDPIGACIGPKGIRIKPVMEELSGERIDIIKWSDDPIVLLKSALQPAKISKIEIVNNSDIRDFKTNKLIKKRVAVFVTEEDRAMAIGKKGQNIRLASDLTGYEIDMYDIGEYDVFMEKFKNIEKENNF